MAEGRASSSTFTAGQKKKYQNALKSGLYSNRQATQIANGTSYRSRKAENAARKKK